MSASASQTLALEVQSPVAERYSDTLSSDVLQFVERLVREFGPEREKLLSTRARGTMPASV